MSATEEAEEVLQQAEIDLKEHLASSAYARLAHEQTTDGQPSSQFGDCVGEQMEEDWEERMAAVVATETKAVLQAKVAENDVYSMVIPSNSPFDFFWT